MWHGNIDIAPETLYERANIGQDELKMFQEVAKELLGFDDRQLATALSSGEIVEVCDGNDKA